MRLLLDMGYFNKFKNNEKIAFKRLNNEVTEITQQNKKY